MLRRSIMYMRDSMAHMTCASLKSSNGFSVMHAVHIFGILRARARESCARRAAADGQRRLKA